MFRDRVGDRKQCSGSGQHSSAGRTEAQARGKVKGMQGNQIFYIPIYIYVRSSKTSIKNILLRI